TTSTSSTSTRTASGTSATRRPLGLRDPPAAPSLQRTVDDERHMTDRPHLERWRALAREELRGKDPESLTRITPDGLEVRPLYTAADLEGTGAEQALPGVAPFVRGPRATMYANRPW